MREFLGKYDLMMVLQIFTHDAPKLGESKRAWIVYDKSLFQVSIMTHRVLINSPLFTGGVQLTMGVDSKSTIATCPRLTTCEHVIDFCKEEKKGEEQRK